MGPWCHSECVHVILVLGPRLSLSPHLVLRRRSPRDPRITRPAGRVIGLEVGLWKRRESTGSKWGLLRWRKGAYCQVWWPEFHPLDPHGRKRKTTPQSWPKTSVCMSWHILLLVVSSKIETFHPTVVVLKIERRQLKITSGSPWNWPDSLLP